MSEDDAWSAATERYHSLDEETKKAVNELYGPWHAKVNGRKPRPTMDEYAAELEKYITQIFGSPERIPSMVSAADDYEEALRAQHIMEQLNENQR
jgi:hypothetical protein